MTVGQTFIDPASHRIGEVLSVTVLRAKCRDLKTGGYFWVRITPWGEPIGGAVNPELLALAKGKQ